MFQAWLRRWRADRRLGRAWSELDELFPASVPVGTPAERRDLLEDVWALDAIMVGSHSSGWPPGAAEEVQSGLEAILQERGHILTAEDRESLVEMGLAVKERAAAR